MGAARSSGSVNKAPRGLVLRLLERRVGYRRPPEGRALGETRQTGRPRSDITGA